MSELGPIKEFDAYIENLLSELNLSQEEKREIEDEWKQHLYDHFASLLKQNISKDEAILTVIEQFGDIQMLQKQVNQTYPSSIKSHVQKETIIVVLCLIASLIGPALLIGAHFRSYLILAPIQALIFAYFIYRFLISRITHWIISLIGLAAIYAFFLQLLPQILGAPLTFKLYLGEIFSLEWDRLTGLSGLFEFVTLHMLWYVILAFQVFSNKNYIPVWKRMINASFQYWAMLIIAVILARFQSSGEWGVLYLNVFLLYAFFQQTISIQGIAILKEKMIRTLQRQRL